MRIHRFASLVLALTCLLSSTAHAFKLKTHVLIVNQVLQGLNGDRFGGLSAAAAGNYLPDVKQALQAHPEAYRAGALGPDVFPDMVAGQLWVHPNQGAAGHNNEPFESRRVEDWRSIDYGMYLLRSAKEYNGNADERLKAIAFAYGYVAHMIGDGFAHSSVNEWAGGAWLLEEGGGTFGKLTEEIKHVAVEAMIDDMSPQHSDAELAIGIPRDFLHQVMTSPVMDGMRQAGPAGSFGGPYYQALSGARDLLRRLGDHHRWTDQDLASWGLNAIDLQQRILSAGSNVGNPINDIEHFFNTRADLFDAVLGRWLWLNECLAQNLLVKSNRQIGAQNLPLQPSEDACDRINFEPDFARGILGSDYGMRLNVAAHTDIGELGTMSDNIARMLAFLEVGIGELLTFDPIRDVASLNTVVNTLTTCQPVLNWGSCNSACADAEDVCQDAACVACGISSFLHPDPTSCLICAGLDFNFGCDAAVNAGSGGVCQLCNSTPVCNAVGDLQALHTLVDTQIRTLMLRLLDPVKQAIVDDVERKLFGDYAAAFADSAELFDMRQGRGGAIWLVNYVFLPEDLRAGGRTLLNEIFVSGMHVPQSVITAPTTAQQYSDATWPTARTRIDASKKADYDSLVKYLWDNSNGVVAAPLTDSSAHPWIDRLASGGRGSSGKFVRIMDSLGLLLSRPGPTARILLEQFSGTTVDPAHIDGVFTDLDVFSPSHNAMALTWRSLFPNHEPATVGQSAICNDTQSIVCDAIASLDDPNHHLFGSGAPPAITAGSEFVPATGLFAGNATDVDRGVYAWGVQQISWNRGFIGATGPCSFGRTHFAATTTPMSIQEDYLAVYKHPENCDVGPAFGSIDTPIDVAGWQPSSGSSTAFIGDGHGGGALQVCGQGFVTVASPAFRTADWPVTSRQMALDVRLPSPAPNPSWLGTARLQVSVPAAGLNNAWIGEQQLTGVATPGQWKTLVFDLPDDVYRALSGDYPNAQFFVSLNELRPGSCWQVDNLRFVGNVQPRSQFHTPSPETHPLATNSFLSFENAGDWTSQNAPTRRVTDRTTDGAAALGVTGRGYSVVTSRAFSTTELRTVGTEMGLDVYIPDPQPNPYWIGQVQLFLTCPTAGINNQFLGQADLTYLFHDEFNTITIPLSSATRSALLRSYSNCRFSIVLNVNNGSGEFVIDRLGFGGSLTSR